MIFARVEAVKNIRSVVENKNMKKENDFYQVSLKILLKNKGKILALKSAKYGSYANYYDLPGGRIDTDEFETNFTEIINREVAEEIGDVKFKYRQNPVATGRHLIPGSITSSGKDIHVMYLFFEAEYLSGEIKISDEHIGYEWFDLSKINLTEYFVSGILEGIKMYINKLN